MNASWISAGPLLVASIGLPLLLALALSLRRLRAFAHAAAPWSALPGLALTAAPEASVDLPWLLLGMRLELDAISRPFLLFTALLWLIAGHYARFYLARRPLRRFTAFFLATLSGNMGVILAQDVASFYLFFSLLTFAAYGLIVHEGGEEARHAGRIYLILMVIGEVLLSIAFMLAVEAADALKLDALASAIGASGDRSVIVALLLSGFGIKAGALSVHMWLPLAHPVAPTPASAVLSGVIIKAGVLGWLRFLPLGSATLPQWGNWCMAAGLGAAFYGAGVGLAQRNPKTVLAYSSISQMGSITVLVGLGLAAPSAWPLVLDAILIYAAHHALAKGALFLGVGVCQRAGEHRYRVFAGLLLPALALAGAPFTSGALAKHALKEMTLFAPSPWPETLAVALPLSAAATALLLARFLFLCWRQPPGVGDRALRALEFCWGLGLLSVALVTGLMFPDASASMMSRYLHPAGLWADLWPLMSGSFVAGLFWHRAVRSKRRAFLAIPPGDLLAPLEWLALRLWTGSKALSETALTHWWRSLAYWSRFGRAHAGRLAEGAVRWEFFMQRVSVASILFLLLLCLFVLAV
ncbi:MAG: complex I subunit 5 family protein [Pseudomonadota bacterium]